MSTKTGFMKVIADRRDYVVRGAFLWNERTKLREYITYLDFSSR